MQITHYRKDYLPHDYKITETNLTFYLDPENTRVQAELTLERQGDSKPLQLDGEKLNLLSISINGPTNTPSSNGLPIAILS